jgi:protein-disulfide isomerase
MDKNRIPGILAPLFISAAIIVSWRYEPPRGPIELAPGTEAPRSPSEIQRAFDGALLPGAPGYERGAPDAKVTVLEFADFGCRYCGSFTRETMPRLLDEYVGAGKVRWKYVPLVMGMFRNGRAAATAAQCAAEQGNDAFWRMHDLLYVRQPEWQQSSADFDWTAYAAPAELNRAQFATCLSAGAAAQRVAAAVRLAEALGVRATPTFFIDGVRVEGALPIGEFRVVLDEALLKR